MFKAQSAEENNRARCAMENSGKREQRVSGRMVPQLGFSVLNGIFGIRCTTPTLAARQTAHCFGVSALSFCCETSAVAENIREMKKC